MAETFVLLSFKAAVTSLAAVTKERMEADASPVAGMAANAASRPFSFSLVDV